MQKHLFVKTRLATKAAYTLVLVIWITCAEAVWAAPENEAQITRGLLIQAAQKTGLQDRPDVAERIRFAQEEALIRAYQANFVAKHDVSEEDLRRAYDSLRVRTGEIEYKVHQIFVPTSDEAQRALDRLKKGERFEAVAADLSRDLSTRQRGGDLGWLSPISIQSHLLPALKALKTGDYTRQPVQGKGGWHIIALDDSRPYQWPSFEQLKPQLRQSLALQAWVTHVNQLKRSVEAR